MLGAIKLLPFENIDRIVIAELLENPGWAEIILISDNDKDFAPICGFGGPELFSIKNIKERVKKSFPAIPYSYVKISHKNSIMSRQEAFSVIMGYDVEILDKSKIITEALKTD